MWQLAGRFEESNTDIHAKGDKSDKKEPEILKKGKKLEDHSK